MLNLSPNSSLLVVAAHADDEAIGCGGLLMAHKGPKVVVICTKPGQVRNSEEQLVYCLIHSSIVADFRWFTLPFEDQRLDQVSQIDCNVRLEKIIEEFNPDVILTHSIHDNNLDHQFVHKSVNVAARYAPNLLYFRIPSVGEFSGFNPQVSIPCNKDQKLALLSCYESEMHRKSRKPIDLDVEYFEVGRLQLCLPNVTNASTT